MIPALLLTFIPYFRMNKRYRCTRNRIVSIILHITVFALATLLLAGLRIDYDLPNEENEVIILIDASESGEDTADKKDEFLRAVIDAADGDFKLGIVTFGFDQVYAAELRHDTENLYNDYLKAPLPDTTATDIEAALSYAATLFEHPSSARIVLLSDAIETDGKAKNTVKLIAGRGIKVDTVYFENREAGDEVQIVSMERPEGKINVGEPFTVKLTLMSSYSGEATLTPYDTDVAGADMKIQLTEGLQTVDVPFEFALPGLHRMSFELTSDKDTLVQNNSYHSYIYLDILNKILVLESIDGESDALCQILDGELNATVLPINDEAVPDTIEELRAFDEVILCNISNADMPPELPELLKSYVYDFGGGLFTVCGNKPDGNPNDEDFTANAYTREDMYGSVYQDMLPVEVINYTPPTAVMILIDRSGSMSTYEDGRPLPDDENKLIFAKKAAEACIDLLSERDYVGIMSFYTSYTEHLELTPRTQRDKILSAVQNIPTEGNGDTILSYALEHAGRALMGLTEVEKKHIIIITDGEPSAADSDRYKEWFRNNADMKITTSIVGVNCTTPAKTTMKSMLTNYAGGTEENFHDVKDLSAATSTIKKDFEVSKITDVNYLPFTPRITKFSAITNGVLQEDMPSLMGFYGLKAKEGAEILLMGTYTPIYTQWSYGAGVVGTFACDLNGTWSADFLASEAGATIINNIVNYLFPDASIAARDIEVKVEGENYKTRLDIFTELSEEEYLEITVTAPMDSGIEPQNIRVGFNDAYSRVEFAVTAPGVHEILVQKRRSDGTLIYETLTYRALSYSLEYNEFPDTKAAELLAAELAADGRGEVYTEPEEVYENAVEFRHITLDPRVLFSIIIIVLFLLDVAVRKFKWKWLHEIIRDRRTERAMSGQTKR